MEKFRYYIVDEDGEIYKTNSATVAQEFSESSANATIDTELQVAIWGDISSNIVEIPS